MGEHILDDLFLVGVTCHKVGCAHRPHHHPHGDEEQGRIQKTHVAVHALGHRVAQKAAVGNQRAVLQHLFLLIAVAVVQKLVQHHAQQLQGKAHRQQQPAGADEAGVKRHQAGFHNAARDDDVHAEVGQALFAAFINDPSFSQEHTHQNHCKQGSLQSKQIAQAHAFQPPSIVAAFLWPSLVYQPAGSMSNCCFRFYAQ